jgi:hypothetical protein
MSPSSGKSKFSIAWTQREAFRAEIPPVRKAFEDNLAKNHTATLREAGMSDADIANGEGADTVGLSVRPGSWNGRCRIRR